jgi:hypothetical protein
LFLLAPLFPVVRSDYFFLLLPYAAVMAAAGADYCARTNVSDKVPVVAILAIVAAVHGAVMVFSPLAGTNNRGDLEKLRYVIETTSQNATIVSSWTPGIAFRRPAFFYYSLHDEIVRVMPPEARSRLEDTLFGGRSPPELVEVDKAFRDNFPDYARRIGTQYTATGVGTLWRRTRR